MQPTPPRERRPSSPTRRRFRPLLLIRRLHLYTGIVLVPWVLLYGVTAFLFNHPTIATDREREQVDPKVLDETPFADPVDAEALAILVAEALAATEPEAVEASFGDGVGPNVDAELHAASAVDTSAPRRARFTRSARIEVRGESASHSFSFDPKRASLVRSKRSFEPDRESPLDRQGFQPDNVESHVSLEEWKESARAIANGADDELGDATVRVRSGPTLAFDLDVEGVTYDVRYDVSRKSVSAEPVDEREGLGWRSYLLRLHLAHTYPDGGGVRWVWAILVDLMAFSMVGWALSGLVMWWQIKKTRRIGRWLVAASALGAAVVGVAMYAALVA
ncbi:MAG: hypothetical protein AAGA20_19290 [Planctomycetota bacterium]